MKDAVFPFDLDGGQIKTVGDEIEIIKQKIKRVIEYGANELPYAIGVGSGIADAVFGVRESAGVESFLRKKVVKALSDIKEIEKANIQLVREENTQSMKFYIVFTVNSQTDSVEINVE